MGLFIINFGVGGHYRHMEDLNVIIAGAAGQGVETIGDILTQTAADQGYAVFSWKEYESRIRGGQNSYSIRISEAPINAPVMEADVLLALNEGAIDKYRPLLKKGGTLLAEKKANDRRMIAIPFAEIAQKVAGKKIYANTVALGALAAVLGIEQARINAALSRVFSGKGKDIIQSNHLAAEKGYLKAVADCADMCHWKLPKRPAKHFLLTTNETISLASVYAGCRFIAAYPMSPSTGIITFLAQHQEEFGVFAEQAEDEIAAINMAIGAGYAGVRAMTATSGGGFALMVEGVSLAGMTETPLVIVLAQRPGPATGLPTRTAQGDLLFAINAGHGEFPKMVFAPSDPLDAFIKTVRAFNLADQYQIPVILMTDQFLSDAHFSMEAFDFGGIEPQFHMADPSHIKDYKRYALTEDGISPRLYPGCSSHLVGADSDEHDEKGHMTEDLPGMAVPMAKKRLAKMKRLKTEISMPEEVSLEESHIIFVGWGSSRQAIVEAIRLLNKDGVNAGMIHFTELWPLPEYAFPNGKSYWTVENNSTGQLASLLRSEYGMDFKGALSRYDGLPLTGDFIRRQFNAQNRSL
jgi:2-oxoglutarate/2-oxoacid ferredoxin oxidoreductase subunit alpha